MARKVCDYCGTEYDDKQQRCPLCGSVNDGPSEDYDVYEEDALLTPPPAARPARPDRREEARPAPERRKRTYVQPEDDEPEDDEPDEPRPARRRGGAREAQREDAIPKWISVLICIFLSLAVLIGAIFALYSLGVLTPKEKPKEDDTSLVLPIDPAKENTDPQTPPATDQSDVIACTAITLSSAEASLDAKNKLFSLKASVAPVDCTEPVVWSSENEAVCTVDQNGTVTAVAEGETAIVATCGTVTAKCVVINAFGDDEPEPAEKPAGNAKLSQEDFTLFKAGETAKLTVTDAPSDAAVSWVSADPSVATVSDNGTVTAVKSGTTTVTATVGTQTLKCIVRCNIKGAANASDENAEVTGSYTLSHSDVTLSKGEAFKLSVTGSTSGHSWSVSDGSVCSVDGDGNVTGVGSGTASVSTTVGGQTLKCVVRVK